MVYDLGCENHFSELNRLAFKQYPLSSSINGLGSSVVTDWSSVWISPSGELVAFKLTVDFPKTHKVKGALFGSKRLLKACSRAQMAVQQPLKASVFEQCF
jgi:hypothetical protein